MDFRFLTTHSQTMVSGRTRIGNLIGDLTRPDFCLQFFESFNPLFFCSDKVISGPDSQGRSTIVATLKAQLSTFSSHTIPLKPSCLPRSSLFPKSALWPFGFAQGPVSLSNSLKVLLSFQSSDSFVLKNQLLQNLTIFLDSDFPLLVITWIR